MTRRSHTALGATAGASAAALLLAFCSGGYAQPTAGTGLHAVPAGTNAWHVAVLDDASVVCAGYDGTICAQRLSDGKELWRIATGEGFPFDLRTADLDGDRRRETLLALSDGTARAFSHDGKPLFIHRTDSPMWQIAAIRIGGRTLVAAGGIARKLYLLDRRGNVQRMIENRHPIRLLAAGDLDGDRTDELIAAGHTGELSIYSGPGLESLAASQMRTSAGRSSLYRPYAIDVTDLDGDGKAEILLGSSFYNLRVVRAMSGKGALLWEENAHPAETEQAKGISHSRAVGCDVTADPGREVVVLDANCLYVMTGDGKKVRSLGVSPIPFSDMRVLREGPGKAEILLGATPNGDDHVYRLRLDGDWPKRLAALHWEGVADRVTRNVETLLAQIKAYQGRAPQGSPMIYHSIGGGHPDSERRLRSLFGTIRRYRSEYPYPDSTEFCLRIGLTQKEPLEGIAIPREASGRGAVLSRDEIVKLLAICETEKIPFFLTVLHSRDVSIGLDTVERVFMACPTTCLGCEASENNVSEFPDLYADYVRPLLDLCKACGRKLLLIEKGAWWVAVPAQPQFKALCDGTYADTLIASVEDSNSRTPELNLMGRAGLYAVGAAAISGRSVQDELCFSRAWEWEVIRSGHPFLRRQVVQALLGASIFEWSIGARDPDGGFSLSGREGEMPLIHMLGKGLLQPPAPAEMAHLSPVVLRLADPSPTLIESADRLGAAEIGEFAVDPAERTALICGISTGWAMAPTPESYFGRYALGCRRSGLNFIPRTPYGFPLILPHQADVQRLPFAATTVWTDGRLVESQGQRLDGPAARPHLIELLKSAATRLPISVEGDAFVQSQWMDKALLRVTLVDPGFLDPADRPVTLRIQDTRPVRNVVDVLSGENLAPSGGHVRLTIPAGTLRIIEISFQ